MATFSDHNLAVYMLQIYADRAGVSRPLVLQNLIAKYGLETVDGFGKMAQGLNFGVITSELQKVADGNGDSDTPSLADINQALLNAGGVQPTIVQDVVAGVQDSATQAVAAASFGLKWVLVLAGVAVLVYAAINFEAVKRMVPGRAA